MTPQNHRQNGRNLPFSPWFCPKVSDQISVDPAQKWAMARASGGPFQTVARWAISTK